GMKHYIRQCIVCNRFGTHKEMHVFPKNREKRKTYVEAVRSTPEGRTLLMKKIYRSTSKTNMDKHAFICSNHFSPSDFKHFAKHTCIKADAVPFFADTELNSGNVDLFQSTLDMSKDMKEEPMGIKDEPIDELDEIKQPIADIFCPSTGTSRPLEISTRTGVTSSDVSGAKHVNTWKFSCSECGRKFRKKGDLINHKYTHTSWYKACRKTKAKNANPTKFSCSKCGKKFISKGGFEYHMKNHA
ncbi:hypothetical protein PMAYCL1PPCAC_05023, partial [Pristionchus mayeri]